jgi:hypothetical protein
MPRRPLVLAMLTVLAACRADSGLQASAAGLETQFDSTRADTVVARVVGEVPATAVRRLVEELRLAPDAEDTTSFAEVFEFDVGLDGSLYVFDASNRVLFHFDSAGGLLRRIGRQGAGPGEFNSNNGMVVLPDGRLALWDSRNGRVSFFTAAGDYQHGWVVPTGFSTNNGLRSDHAGALYTVRPLTPPREGEILGRMGLIRFGAEGALADSLLPPDLPWTRVVYVATVQGNTSATSPTHAPRFLWQWHSAGYYVSVSTERYVIEVSRPGRALRIERDAPPLPVSDDERAYDEERITFNLRQTEPGWKFSGPPIPAQKPPVAGLFTARDGRIWVRVAVPSVAIPEAERDPSQPNRVPPRRYRDESVTYEVFAADGRFLGRVVLPWQSTLMEADGDRLWFLDRDADGLPAIVRARVEPGLR